MDVMIRCIEELRMKLDKHPKDGLKEKEIVLFSCFFPLGGLAARTL